MMKKLPVIRRYFKLKENVLFWKDRAEKLYYYYEQYNLLRLEMYRKEKTPLKVVIGSEVTQEMKGWVHTEQSFLDITSDYSWSNFLGNSKLENILAEHVVEHLSLTEAKNAFQYAHKNLQVNGVMRIAVPDGFNPDEKYIKNVSPEFDGAKVGHLVLWNIDLLTKCLEDFGFSVVPHEFYKSEGQFVSNKWDFSNGFIKRSYLNNTSNGKDFQRSLIVDAIKRS